MPDAGDNGGEQRGLRKGLTNYGDEGFSLFLRKAFKLIDAVKRGVLLAGGLPVAFPKISIAERFSHPTSMYLRKLMSMDTEEMIRAQPMGAAAASVPAIQLVTGAMPAGSHRGERVGVSA